MPIKHTDFVIQGMFRDMSEHGFDSKFAYENQNLRITAEPNSSSTHTGDMYALTNEKGNKYVPIWGLDSTGHNRMNGDKQIFNDTGDMWGVPVGQALLNDKWVVFMIDRDKDIFIDGVEREIEDFPIQITQIQNLKVDSNDRIYKLWFNNDKMYGTLLYEGHLNLSSNFPLETLPYYENSQIQKVYWTDGLNQPRYINIEATDEEKAKWTDTSFDFVSTIELLNHKVTITENTTGGMFPAGVIQWYFTYGKQFGPESNIFTQTGLYELKHPTRGAAPDEYTTQSFTIKLTGLDYEHFDSVNIYSVIRTSINGVPNCKLVANIKLSGTSFEYVDTNLTGEAIDPTSLFYKGGEPITAYTFEQKENTLFLGNYSITRPYISSQIKDSLRSFAFYGNANTIDPSGRYLKTTKGTGFKFTNGSEWGNKVSNFLIENVTNSTLKKKNNTTSKVVSRDYDSSTAQKLTDVPYTGNVSYFKNYNIYRVGIQFQHYTGKWSEVVWLGDYKCTDDYRRLIDDSETWFLGYFEANTIGYLNLNSVKSVIESLIHAGYRMVRPVIIYPTISEKTVLGQGVLCNTVRPSVDANTVYPDYFFRPVRKPNVDISTYAANTYSTESVFVQGYRPPFESYGQIWKTATGGHVMNNLINSINDLSENHFIQDGTVVDIYSSDIEFDDAIKVYNLDNITLKKHGEINIYNQKCSVEIQTSTIAKANIGVNRWYSNIRKKGFFSTWTGRQSIYYDWELNYGIPGGYGRDNNSAFGYHYASKDEMYLPTSYYPNKFLLSGSNIYISGCKHYTGGYVWNDFIRNLGTRHDENLDMDVPSKPAVFMANSYNYIFPVFLWQPSGSICYDKDSEASSVLKSNKTLNYFTSNQYLGDTRDYTDSTQTIQAECKFVDTFDTKKLFSSGDNVLLYKSNVDTSFLHGDDYYAYTLKCWDFHSGTITDWNKYNIFAGCNITNEVFGPNLTLENGTNTIGAKNHLEEGFTVDGIKSIYRYYDADVVMSKVGFYKWAKNSDSADSPEPEEDTFHWLQDSIKIEPENEFSNTYTFVTQVKYKTVPHIISVLTEYIWDSSWKQTYGNFPDKYLGNGFFNNKMVGQNAVGLPIVDIMQDVELSTIYGGYSEAVLQRCSFLPCGDTVSICHWAYNSETQEDELVPNTNIEIVWDKGDIHRQHYECLKTYPYTLEDENSVTEVLDVELETYYNLNGRYDTWKGNPQLSTMPSNFNLMNPVYNQQDNFMVYHGLDLSKFSVSNFPNSFTWTLTKNAGDEIDKWTQITLANTLDVDMNRGQITKIIGLQDNLLCFQPKGISQILYNEREQISTASGVPIEIGNSGKVNGTRYLSILAGCNNKWSMCKSEKGLYWVDDVNKQILNFTTQVTNLSDALGFHSWINDMASLNIWTPLGFYNFVSYFDPYNEDVVFYYKNNALSFSEQLNCFDTFLPYRFVPYYMPFHNSAFTLSDRDSDGKDTYRVWEHHKGNYNYFYVHDRCTYEAGYVHLKGRYDNENNPTDYGYEPYWTTLLVNPDMPYDKVFNNMDMRTDMWAKGTSGNYDKLLEETFSHIEVWNEFQWNKSQLIQRTDIPKLHLPKQHSILKKKFRVWYTNIPRDITEPKDYIYEGIGQEIPTRGGIPTNRYYNRDRIRNTWMYMKLSKELINNDPVIEYPYISDNKHNIHHIGVSYFI